MENVKVKVTVNGRSYERETEPRRLLSDFIREDLRLTGTHVGCEHGVCGSCTVLMDGQTTRSCLTFAAMADGAEIDTIEGLGTVEALELGGPTHADEPAARAGALRQLGKRHGQNVDA